jgi:hypothetical protein
MFEISIERTVGPVSAVNDRVVPMGLRANWGAGAEDFDHDDAALSM